MKTSLLMYVRRHGKREHEKVLCLMDWQGLDEEDIKTLASFYVFNRAKELLRMDEHTLPESVEFLAADFLHKEAESTNEYVIPPAWKSGEDKPKNKKKSAQDALYEMLLSLSAEDREKLMR